MFAVCSSLWFHIYLYIQTHTHKINILSGSICALQIWIYLFIQWIIWIIAVLSLMLVLALEWRLSAVVKPCCSFFRLQKLSSGLLSVSLTTARYFNSPSHRSHVPHPNLTVLPGLTRVSQPARPAGSSGRVSLRSVPVCEPTLDLMSSSSWWCYTYIRVCHDKLNSHQFRVTAVNSWNGIFIKQRVKFSESVSFYLFSYLGYVASYQFGSFLC